MIKPKQLLQKTEEGLLRIRMFVIGAILFGLFGYLAWQVQKILSPPVNKDRLEQRELELEAEQIKLDETTVKEILRRSQTGPSTEPDNTGDPNPFD